MQYSFPYVINVDWLQVFCHDLNQGRLNEIYYEHSLYEFILQKHSSRHFKEIWEVVDEDGDKYATIQRIPHSNVISSDGAIIQLSNRELYKPHFAADFLLFLSAHGFKYKSISRLDVCFDSNFLRNRLSHTNFIKGIMTEKYLKNNQSKVKWHFDAIANIGKPMQCNSCSFGSLSSPVSTKMYNKTLEMKEQKSKPYIIESWQYNGLDINKDVWRIEISIKSDASNTIRTDTGEIFRLSMDSLRFQSIVQDIFFSYAEKYFAFKVNDGKKNKTRMQDLQIFPDERIQTLHPVRITEEKDSGRSDRIFLKKLLGLRTEFKRMDKQTWDALGEVINAFTLSRNLAVWQAQKREIDLHRKDWNAIQLKNLQEDIQNLIQRLLDEHPRSADKVHDLATIIFQILRK